MILLAALLTATQPTPAAQAPQPTPARHAVMIGGSISNLDYPAAAVRARQEGRTIIGFTVDERGRARNCFLMESSGSTLLDRQTCGIATARFRFRPARDAADRAVTQEFAVQFDWALPRSVRITGPTPLSAVKTTG